MNRDIKEYMAELNQSYNDLGEDLLMLEAVLLARGEETGFPGEYITSSVNRLADYIDQHVEELQQLTEYLARRRINPRRAIGLAEDPR